MLDTDLKNLRIYKHERRLLTERARRIHRRIYQLSDLIDKLEKESKSRSVSSMITTAKKENKKVLAHALEFLEEII